MTTYDTRRRKYYHKNKTKILKGIKLYYLANENKLKRNQLKTRYNLTLERFNEMLIEQEGQCSVCRTAFSDKIKPVVDHDHSCCPEKTSCGKCIRALICHNCNKGIGLLKDNLAVVQRAVEYLKKYSQNM